MIAVYGDTDPHPCDAEGCKNDAFNELVLMVCGSSLWSCVDHVQDAVIALIAHAQEHAATAAMN